MDLLADPRPIVPTVTLPLVVEPEADIDASPTALAAWAAENGSTLDAWLHRAGAVLFRGFAVDGPDAFRAVAQAIRPDLASYAGGDSPRSAMGDGVYTSTEYPPNMEIGLHNELSYTGRWPERLFFCCITAAALGGETPIADSRAVCRLMDPAVRDRFAERGVLYLQHLRDESVPGPDKSWQATFETTDRDDVERLCRERGMDYRWTERGLSTAFRTEAVRAHPVTGEPCWFNQADLWHASFDTVKGYHVEREGEQFLGSDARFGDGGEIRRDDLEAVRAACRAAEVAFPWLDGDFLVLDNMLAMHGRRPYEGDRRVLVAMA